MHRHNESMSEGHVSMKSKVCTLIAISVLTIFMAWQCVTWPVVEMGGRWVKSESEAQQALSAPVERPPTTGEVAVRCAACTASLLVGAALVRVLRSAKTPSKVHIPVAEGEE